MILNNPYLYHPHPLCKVAAGDLCSAIKSNPDWEREFSKGKMLGVLLIRRFGDNRFCDSLSGISVTDNDPRVHIINNEYAYLAAYSGIVNIDKSVNPSSFDHLFVPPVYDLSVEDDFYKAEEEKISAINTRIKELETNAGVYKHQISELKRERKERSQALQIEIFKHFNFTNYRGEEKNILDIFSEAKRGLPPGGAGECAAPRLLQYAFTHGLEPVAMAEFWYGYTPRKEIRLHKQFYPSCIEKCSPILAFMLPSKVFQVPGFRFQQNHLSLSLPFGSPFTTLSLPFPKVLFEDESIIIVEKPAELLSTPAKDTTLQNVETWLHEQYPEVKGPMLVHRLDQSTSGIMIAAKNAAVYKTLQAGFLDHSIRKTYLAWLDGNLQSECGVINLPICPNPDDRPRQTVDRQFGKQSITRYRVIKRVEGRSLLALYPFTGRTHQLRLHCASSFGLDIPIAGDQLYSIADSINPEPSTITPTNRLMLHAQSVTFPHPITGESMTFSCNL